MRDETQRNEAEVERESIMLKVAGLAEYVLQHGAKSEEPTETFRIYRDNATPLLETDVRSVKGSDGSRMILAYNHERKPMFIRGWDEQTLTFVYDDIHSGSDARDSSISVLYPPKHRMVLRYESDADHRLLKFIGGYINVPSYELSERGAWSLPTDPEGKIIDTTYPGPSSENVRVNIEPEMDGAQIRAEIRSRLDHAVATYHLDTEEKAQPSDQITLTTTTP